MASENLELIKLVDEDVILFKKYLQEAFQQGYEAVYGRCEELVLPENDMNECLEREDSHAFELINQNNEILGGAVVTINEKTNHNHLDFLFVKVGIQSRGLGQLIWAELEKMYPDTEIWETHTPYFDKRNIHFYVNKLGFHIVEFFNDKHQDLEDPIDNFSLEEGIFRFEKIMKKRKLILYSKILSWAFFKL